MEAADAAPGGGLLWAEAGGDASASMRATPIEAKVALRIVVSRVVGLTCDGAGAILLIMIGVRLARFNRGAPPPTPAVR